MAATSSSRGAPRPSGGGGGGNKVSKNKPSSEGRSRTSGTGQSSQSGQSQQPQKKEIIGNYLLQKKLGVGTFGEVRLAIHIPTGKKLNVNYCCFSSEHFQISFKSTAAFK